MSYMPTNGYLRNLGPAQVDFGHLMAKVPPASDQNFLFISLTTVNPESGTKQVYDRH